MRFSNLHEFWFTSKEGFARTCWLGSLQCLGINLKEAQSPQWTSQL
jgi:hypothetical protein